ncbi:MAG: hypothetical protein K2I34_09875, partial [Paramuribaculum sp.]|nr:hypothetical protein [Paramuribaculum sp.]
MKKFLLTLLGASLLCGLSPHPLSAQVQTKTVSFKGWKDQNPEFRYSRQMKIAHTQGNTYTTSSSSTKYNAALDETLQPTEYPSNEEGWTPPINYAQGQFNWGDFQMEMDYSNAAYTYNSNKKTTWTTTVQNNAQNQKQTWRYTSNLLPASNFINIYPGVDIKFSTPGKRIKKVILHTGMNIDHSINKWSFNSSKMFSNLKVIDKLGSTKDTQTSTKSTMQFVDNNGKADIVLTSKDLFGSEDGIYLKVNGYDGMYYTKNGLSDYYYYPIPLNTEATKASYATSRPSNSACQDQLVFRITSIDVEYYENCPFTQVVTFSKTNDKFLFKDHNTGWKELTQNISITQTTVSESGREYYKIGNAIIEVDKASAPKFIAQYNTTHGMGLYVGTKFRIYPDPEIYKMDDGTPAKAYRVTIKSHSQSSSDYSFAYYSGINLIYCHDQ